LGECILPNILVLITLAAPIPCCRSAVKTNKSDPQGVNQLISYPRRRKKIRIGRGLLTINECSFIIETMRHKDDKKNRAICDAAIELITAHGFAETSMAKIAKVAKVSPATIYVYFENKESLLNATYLFVKQEMSTEMLQGVDPNFPVEKIFKMIWTNYCQYAMKNPVRFAFTEQFANSPMIDRLYKQESSSYFQPLLEMFDRGKKEKVFKDISLEVFQAFTFAPLTGLIKEHFSGGLVLDEEMLETTYKIAWDAVTN